MFVGLLHESPSLSAASSAYSNAAMLCPSFPSQQSIHGGGSSVGHYCPGKPCSVENSSLKYGVLQIASAEICIREIRV